MTPAFVPCHQHDAVAMAEQSFTTITFPISVGPIDLAFLTLARQRGRRRFCGSLAPSHVPVSFSCVLARFAWGTTLALTLQPSTEA
jgi:hypothetical protein